MCGSECNVPSRQEFIWEDEIYTGKTEGSGMCMGVLYVCSDSILGRQCVRLLASLPYPCGLCVCVHLVRCGGLCLPVSMDLEIYPHSFICQSREDYDSLSQVKIQTKLLDDRPFS